MTDPRDDNRDDPKEGQGSLFDFNLFPFDLGSLGRLLLVIVATGALVTLAVVLITAGLLNLLGFGPGDVARLTPPGRAGTMAEVAVSAARKG